MTVRLTVADTQCSVIPFPPQPCTPGTTNSTTTFTVTVNATVATFAPVSNSPGGSHGGHPRRHDMALYAGSQNVTSNKAVHKVTVVGPGPSGQVRTYRSTDPGTAFQYINGTKTWQFTLQTGAAATLPAGTYQVVIGPSAPTGYQSSKAFSLVINP